ncbi:sporulation protein YunB [Lysinibacillus sp. FJAT-14222]|uniref:sporulation protein YunB n=1 Tax=Lysinibacillus sp. FJAT-14222 TaxID=1932366 RepID=UPI0006ADD123|nr:sporulation protein YunB [Lysinibacillus sp. FJAT-14222]KOS63899.1 sporulation protein [Lysinibacillus sp. FJAT-14222]
MEQEEIFLFFPRKRMKLRSYSNSGNYRKKGNKLNRLTLLIVSIVVGVILFIYFLNERLMPTYLQYAEVQTTKIASYVVSKATANNLDINDVLVEVSPGSNSDLTINTEIINRVRAETVKQVKLNLEQAEQGELSHLPNLDNVEYDYNKIKEGNGVVFYIPISQAANIPLLGNLGPKIPVRFHVIGNVHSEVTSSITEYGINSALVEVGIHLEVNVQIIVPFASKTSTISQDIPVAIGIARGQVPNVYSNGDQATHPSIEIPIPNK